MITQNKKWTDKDLEIAYINGCKHKQKEVLEIIKKFKGRNYTDIEIWEDIKRELIKQIEGK